MDHLHVDIARGERCVLVFVSNGCGKVKQYEYEQDADLIMSIRDGLAKWENGDENFRLDDK